MTPFVWTSATEWSHACERVMPSAAVQLLFNLEESTMQWFDAPTPRPKTQRQVAGAAIGGPFGRPFCIETRAQRRLVGVVLPIGTAQAWLNMPISELAHQHVAADVLPALRGLRQRLLEAPWPEVASVMRAELRRRLTPGVPCLASQHALRQLAAGQTVTQTARDMGLSTKRLRRRFGAAIGLTPKQFQRVHRFRCTLARLARCEAPRLADLALEMGYTDQAHMTHELRVLGAVTPGRYAPRSREDFGHIAL